MRPIHRTIFALLLLLPSFADAATPERPFATKLNVIVRAPPSTVRLNDTTLGYSVSWGPLLGTAFGAMDASRARKAMAELEPSLRGVDPWAWFIEAARTRLDPAIWGAEIEVSEHDFGNQQRPSDEVVPPLTGRTLILWPEIVPAPDFARFHVYVRAVVIDPGQKLKDAAFQTVVEYIAEFPEINVKDARVENAKQIAALGRDKFVARLQAAVPELFAMLDYEAARGDQKEKLGEKRRLRSAFGPMTARVVRENGDREWVRWKAMLMTGNLVSTIRIEPW